MNTGDNMALRAGPTGQRMTMSDGTLAKHCNFTGEELEFITSYDIKYRMGDALVGT